MRKICKAILSLGLCSFMVGCSKNSTSYSIPSISSSTNPRPVIPHEFDENNILMKLGVVSDIHNSDNIPQAMQFLSAWKGGMDGLIIAGDLTDGVRYYGTESYEIDQVKNKILNNIKPDLPIFFTLGNHDTSNSSKTKVFFEKLGMKFYNKVCEDDLESAKNKGFYHSYFNGYHFISLECNYGSQETGGEWAETIADGGAKYLRDTLSAITSEETYNNEYIFVISHLIPKGALNKSSQNDAINDVLKDFSQVLFVAGHDHNTCYDEMNINQDTFTCINPGSLHFSDFYRVDKYIENLPTGNEIITKDGYTSRDLPTGMMIYIDTSGNIKIERLDFKHQNFLINDPWYLKKPKSDKSHLLSYTSNRLLLDQSPYWDVNSNLLASYDSTKKEITITFNRPKDEDDYIYEYIIETLNNSGQIIKTYYTLSDFFIYPNTLDMPKTFKIIVPQVDSKPHSLSIRGMDNFRKETTTLTCLID